jgi:hypothetical protein
VDLGPIKQTLLLVWVMVFLSWVGYVVFSDLSSITGNVVAALGLIVGILATVLKFLSDKRKKDASED